MSKENSPIDQARDIREGERLPIEKLSNYLTSQLAGFNRIDDIKQFPGGYSNLTYLIKTPDGEYVLRRPPFGANIKSAHDMGREYNVLSLLQHCYDKAPRPLLHCESNDIIGAPFYLMERVKGVILRTSNPPNPLPSPETMRKVSEATVDNLALLHSLDIKTTGLDTLGKPEGYTRRQVDGWIRRYRRSETDTIEDMDTIARWIDENCPADIEPAFIHNDYKYDNLVLNPDNLSEIKAVLDWEMATVGNPLMDLGTSLSYWVEEHDSPALKMFNLTSLPGNLSRIDVLERYAEKSGRDTSGILFYFVYASFKLGVILQQIYARYVKGHTKDPRFAALIHVVRACAQNGSKALQYGRIHDFY